MPSNTAEQVAALERRMAGASSVDSVSVDKTLLAALLEAWRNWQMVEAMPVNTDLNHTKAGDWATNAGEDWVCGADPAAALAAAFKEGTDGE